MLQPSSQETNSYPIELDETSLFVFGSVVAFLENQIHGDYTEDEIRQNVVNVLTDTELVRRKINSDFIRSDSYDFGVEELIDDYLKMQLLFDWKNPEHRQALIEYVCQKMIESYPIIVNEHRGCFAAFMRLRSLLPSRFRK